jgi:hypothetical protein
MHMDETSPATVVEPPAGLGPAAGPPPLRPRARWKRFMVRWLLILAALYVVWCLVLVVFQDRLIFPGTFMRRDGDSLERPPDAIQIWRDIGGGQRVEAWFILGRGCSAGTPGPLVVYAHGNGELIDDHPPGLSF